MVDGFYDIDFVMFGLVVGVGELESWLGIVVVGVVMDVEDEKIVFVSFLRGDVNGEMVCGGIGFRFRIDRGINFEDGSVGGCVCEVEWFGLSLRYVMNEVGGWVVVCEVVEVVEEVFIVVGIGEVVGEVGVVGIRIVVWVVLGDCDSDNDGNDSDNNDG